MQKTFSAIARSFRNSIFMFGLIALIGISGLFVFTATPSFASTNNRQSIQQNSPNSSADHNRENPQAREQAYDEVIKEIDEPKGLEKAYEENLKNYEKTQPNKGIIQAAEDLVENVTGQK